MTTINAGEPAPELFPPTEPAPPTGWWNADTRLFGTVAVNSNLGAPVGFGCKSAELITGNDNSQGKAQLFNYEQYGTPLGDIDEISYWAKKSSASTGGAATHLALNVVIVGPGVGPQNYAFLVYEPYNQSGSQAAIQLDTWQHWDATATTPGDGRWWSSKIASGPGSQGAPITWADFQTLYPTAEIAGYGFNLGSYNPNTIVAGDGLKFGSVTTNF